MTKAPLILGHRGASAEAPENTVKAFERAMRDGADGVELDVMRCKTGELVVFHDDDLQRLTGAAGETRAQPWSALRELSVRGEPIPQLDEVLEAVGPRAFVNVELKTHPHWAARLSDDGLAACVAILLRRCALGPRALVSSFDPVLLRRFRNIAPEISTGLLFAADQSLPLRRGWAAPFVGALAVHPEAVLVDETSMHAWRRRGLGVNVWTVDDPAVIRYLASLGVDSIITNRPREARQALGAGMEGRRIVSGEIGRERGGFEDERTPVSQLIRVEEQGRKRQCLVRLTGAQLGEVIVIDRELIIGRETEGGLSLLHDRGVSREHAKVVLVGEGAMLVDLGSTNGTFVDGVRIKEKLLSEGDKLRIGQTTVLKYARYDDAELKMQRHLVEEALRDGMTRVFNRRYFMERLESELGFGDRHSTPVSLVLFDLDHFKGVNDVYGHLVGDRILCDLSQVCLRTLRNEDVLARYGGEEFIVLLRGILQDGAVRLAERLRRAIELAQLGAEPDPPRPVTISVGVATFTSHDFKPLKTARDRLVGAADAALYRAKAAGRNCVKS